MLGYEPRTARGNRIGVMMTDPLECEMLSFEQIDFNDPIFDSLRVDYPDFESWINQTMKTSSSRCAFVVPGPVSYRGITLLKSGEGPDGPSPKGLKISTFKVVHQAEAQGIADMLLSRVLQRAIELEADVVFITLLPGHEDLVRYLELRGFRRAARDLSRGERVYVAELTNPERLYSSLNRLAYDLLADEYRARADVPGSDQESPEYLAGLLTSRLQKPIDRVLELGPGSGTVLSALGKIAGETVAVEISPRMADVARLRAPDALIVVADVLSVDFPDRSFDGVYAGAFLHLFPKLEAANLVRRIARWTKLSGAIFANTTISNQSGESIEVKADYIKRVARFRSRWTEEQFRELLEHNGLRITDRVTTDEHERDKFWVAFLCTPSESVGG